MAVQLLPALTRDPATVAREQPVGRHLPYARHVDDHTIATRDGLLMQIIHLRGLLFETADTDELNYRKRLRDAMLQAIGSSRFALCQHIVRRRVEAEVGGDYPDPFSRQLAETWHKRLSTRRLYANDLFLTLIRRPLPGRLGKL
ncbi:MAG: VirB4 family type IV secretion/conjugal transfer ATPase, partial [Thermaurantiacus sp.]